MKFPRSLVRAATIAMVGVGAAVVFVAPSNALEVSTSVTTSGSFDPQEIYGANGGTPNCVYTSGGVARFGRPDGMSAPTCGEPTERSGFRFSGVTSEPVTTIDRFEVGRFTHYNQPIITDPTNVGTAELKVTMNFGPLGTIEPAYEVTLNETDNNPAGSCVFGDNPADGCDDGMAIEAPTVPPVLHYENTQFAIRLGFAPIVDGQCSTAEPTASVVTPEGRDTTFCLIGSAVPASLTITKTTTEGGDGTFEFGLQEYSTLGVPIGDVTTIEMTTVSNVATTTLADLEPGLYRLTEANLPGWDEQPISCNSAGADNSPFVTLGGVQYLDVDSSEVLSCSVNNVAVPVVDFAVSKFDDGVEAVAGGAPFEYVITVRNVSGNVPNPAQPVTVTDFLPADLRWVTTPNTCTVAGQDLTCELNPASLSPGQSVQIPTTVRALSTAPSGIATNVVWVDSEDDPVCVGIDCVPPPCPALDNNNVYCEETPILRIGEIEILKTDDVADDEVVYPGSTYSYTLRVKNTGPTTLSDGLEVADDLPDELQFISASGTGWTCTGASTLRCSYAGSLNPGASAPVITVKVQVAPDVAARLDRIDNVAIVTAAVDRDCEPTGGSQAYEEACNEVTDDDDESTPLRHLADPAIEKRSSAEQFSVGDTFDWILDVTNLGPGLARDVVVNDALPADVDGISVSSDEFECTLNADDEVRCTKPTLAVGEKGTITIKVKIVAYPESGRIDNLATVDSSTPDKDLDNNEDDDDVRVTRPAPPPVTNPPVTVLPETGSPVGGFVAAATALLLLGAGALFTTRRRRPL